MRRLPLRPDVIVPVLVGLASAVGSLLVMWLPEADPGVIEWPEFLLVVAAPLVAGVLLRRSPAGARVVAAIVGVAVGACASLLGAVVLFIAGSSWELG